MLQCCECYHRGWYNCDCEEKDWQKWQHDFLHQRRFSPPPVRSVSKEGAMVINRQGIVQGPFLHSEWLEYCFYLFDLCHDWAEGKENLDWSKVYFRHESDFIGRTFNLFYPIAFLMTPKLVGLEIKHGVANDGGRGVDLFETLLPKDLDNNSVFRGKGQMHTIPRPYYEYLNEVHKIDPWKFDYKAEAKKWQQNTSIFSKRARLMKKKNRIRTWQKAMHFFPRKKHKFELWYPKVKQVPFWYDFKEKEWQLPFFLTDPAIEKAQMKLFNTTIEKWLKTGCLFILDEDEDYDLVAPCVLANVQLPNKPPPEPGKKPRLCHDGGWEKAIEKYGFPCKLEDLRKALRTLKKGNLMSVSDDMRGFHQLGLNRESAKLTVFSYQNMLFAYSVCPFGSPKIPSVFQRYNLLAANYARSLGQKSLLYLDDRALIDDPAQIQNGIGPSCIITSSCSITIGGYISLAKSDFTPKHRQRFLGLVLDTEQGTIEVPTDKWEAFKTTATRFIQQQGCTFKELEKFRGKAVSFILCNPMTKLFIRQMNKIIAESNAKKVHPSQFLQFPRELVDEIKEWLRMDHLKMKHYWANLTDTPLPPNRVTFTDASSFAAAAIVFDENGVAWEKQWNFNEYQQGQPIFYKEGLAILWMLVDFPDILSDKYVLHFCDNESVTLAYKGKGSKVLLMQEVILSIYKKLHSINSTMNMVWITTHRQLADAKSREVNWNEEFLPMPIFTEITRTWDFIPQIDLMATEANTKCIQYMTFGRDRNPNCLAYDFFSFPPGKILGKKLYIFPPKNLIDQTCQHLEKYYKNHSFLLIYHSFGTIPHAVTSLIKKAHKHQQLTENCTIIPDEVKLLAFGRTYWGFWNTRKTATFALLVKGKVVGTLKIFFN